MTLLCLKESMQSYHMSEKNLKNWKARFTLSSNVLSFVTTASSSFNSNTTISKPGSFGGGEGEKDISDKEFCSVVVNFNEWRHLWEEIVDYSQNLLSPKHFFLNIIGNLTLWKSVSPFSSTSVLSTCDAVKADKMMNTLNKKNVKFKLEVL